MRPDRITWRKSSYSTQEGGQCVELASLVQQIRPGDYTWRMSSYSSQEGGTCIEVATLSTAIGVRDSTDPDGPVLQLSRPAVAGLVSRIKSGQLDR
ncbi:DUF397 domain-containing protein [Actinomadura sp. 3N508]|uniref:DUF397 domain-containing protein n=1 Tax=Actinomadura sp. 3N508 TaxID=3375153 RepID=UPI0037A6B341